ncbi:unnamed protein product, partial [Choristocarpus tenellus]
MVFAPEGQHLYCASSTGLRMWSWDNEKAVAQLERHGEVPWVGINRGGLHFNVEGRQLIAGACASNFVSIWAVD